MLLAQTNYENICVRTLGFLAVAACMMVFTHTGSGIAVASIFLPNALVCVCSRQSRRLTVQHRCILKGWVPLLINTQPSLCAEAHVSRAVHSVCLQSTRRLNTSCHSSSMRRGS